MPEWPLAEYVARFEPFVEEGIDWARQEVVVSVRCGQLMRHSTITPVGTKGAADILFVPVEPRQPFGGRWVGYNDRDS